MTTLVIITGASRGLGRALALSFTKTHHIQQAFHLRITSSPNSTDALSSLRHEIQALRGVDSSTISNITTTVEEHSFDMAQVATLPLVSTTLFAPINAELSEVIFINNHGSLGDLSFVGSHDLERMQTAINTNVTSCMYLTSEAVRFAQTLPSHIPFIIVNISSLCAIQAFPSWGVYCAGKAARDMYHKVLAEELKDSNIKCFNYAPGPLDTDMQRQIREGEHVHEETKQYYIDMKNKGILVTAEDSAEKCVKIVRSKAFVTGSHLDYFDTVDGI